MLWQANNKEVQLRRQQRNKRRKCLESVEDMPDTLFVQRFRLNKVVFRALCQELRNLGQLKATNEIPIEVKVRDSIITWCLLLYIFQLMLCTYAPNKLFICIVGFMRS